MRTTLKNVISLIILISVSAAMSAQKSLSAEEIIKKSNEQMQGNSSQGMTSMKIIRPTWEREIIFKNWAKGHDYSMTYVISPAKEKGQAFLKRVNEMWSWNPTISRSIKLPSSMMSQNWMGSDYTNEDILKESSIVTDYIPTLMGEEKINDKDCYIVRLKARPASAVIWDMMLKWITKDSFLQLKTEYFDEYGTLIRTDNSSQIKYMDDREIPTITEVIPSDKEGHKTIITIMEIKYNVSLNDNMFSIQNLKNIR